MNSRILAAALAALTLPAVASAQFAPKNDLWKQDAAIRKMDPKMTQKEFDAISQGVIDVFAPFADLHGGKLSVNADWNDSTVNASAEENGTSWVVNMYGGLARRPEITYDGYKGVICHELGHHFGGFAFYSDDDWAAAEGEADYFATQFCLGLLFVDEKAVNATFRTNVPKPVQAKCDLAWKTVDEQNLCYRIAAAGQSLANLLAKLEGAKVPDVTKPDPSIVTTTDVDHPHAQCRLDTYFNGALCATKTFDIKTIPGKANAAGQTSKAAQDEAAEYSCLGTGAMAMGERPRCWFKPLK